MIHLINLTQFKGTHEFKPISSLPLQKLEYLKEKANYLYSICGVMHYAVMDDDLQIIYRTDRRD